MYYTYTTTELGFIRSGNNPDVNLKHVFSVRTKEITNIKGCLGIITFTSSGGNEVSWEFGTKEEYKAALDFVNKAMYGNKE